MNQPKRIQLDPSKLLGVRQLEKPMVHGKIAIAKAMVGLVKVCSAPQAGN